MQAWPRSGPYDGSSTVALCVLLSHKTRCTSVLRYAVSPHDVLSEIWVARDMFESALVVEPNPY